MSKVGKKSQAMKVWKATGIVIGSLVIVIFIIFAIIGVVIPQQLDADGNAIMDLGEWARTNVCDLTQVPDLWAAQYKTIIHRAILIVVIFAFSKLLCVLFHKIMKKSNRAKTVITLFDGLIKCGCAIALIFLLLSACGVNTAAIWGSVGVLTLIICLGAQSLIADTIAGLFIIFENEYNVGEIVSIDDFRGTVAEIGIRTTKILDMAGNIKIINNSDIENVVNLSKELSLAAIECKFPYDVPLEFVEKLLKDNFENFKEKIPAIIEGPFYKGVSAYEASNVVVKIVAKCSEEDRYQVQRDLMRECRQLFVANGIDISYDQAVVNRPSKTEIKVTKKDKNEAEKFVEEQKNASDGLDK